jgi:hypothetical protein
MLMEATMSDKRCERCGDYQVCDYCGKGLSHAGGCETIHGACRDRQLDQIEAINARYASVEVDPTYAGERWDDEY